jgi:parallel beta-helix repeat protein
MRVKPSILTKLSLTLGALFCSCIMPVSAVATPAGTPMILHPGGNASEVEIQRALDQLPAGGGTVILPPGIYEIHHPVILNRNGMTLSGSGDRTILRLADQADCPVVVLGSTLGHPKQILHDLRLSDLVIDGNRTHQLYEQWRDPLNTSGIQNNGIMIQAVSNSIVERVVAAHCRSGGLVTANRTRNLTVRDFTSFDNQFDGLACYETENSVFTKLDLHDNQCAGISLDLDFNHNVISDSTLTSNDLGIFMRESRGNQFRNLTIGQSRHDGVFLAQWGTFAPATGWRLIPQTECADNRFSELKIHACAGVAFCVHDPACVNNVVEDGIFSGNLNDTAIRAGNGQNRSSSTAKSLVE